MVPYLGDEIAYVDGNLYVENVDLRVLGRDNDVGTPVYVYSTSLMKRRYGEFASAMRAIDPRALICFAVKSLSNQSVLRLFKAWGAGADLVTRGELERVLNAQFDPRQIVFSGLGKTDGDIKRAITAGVQINVESISELKLVQDCAEHLDHRAKIAIRLNPQLEAMRGHLAQITTGKPDSKFGIPWTKVEELLRGFKEGFPHLELVGPSVHIGSNLDVDGEGADSKSFEETFKFLAETANGAFSEIIAGPVTFDLGGGVGVDYNQVPGTRSATGNLRNYNRWLDPYAKLVSDAFGHLVRQGRARLVFEPGRFLCGEAGVLLCRVLHVKDETEREMEGGKRATFSIRFVIVDAGLNDLLRPSLYGAYHHIVPVQYSEPDLDNVDICGAACETTDSFMRPTREWLRRYNNLFEDSEDGSKAPDLDSASRKVAPRTLWGERSTFGEVSPQYTYRNGRLTYEYFVKRRFPSSVKAGDFVAILNAGAYGAVMSSEYNSRPLVAEVLVDDDRYAVIRPRPSYEELIARDRQTAWKSASL